MTLPSFSAALGAPSTTPMPALADGPLPDGAGATADAAPGGFADLLKQAAAGAMGTVQAGEAATSQALSGKPDMAQVVTAVSNAEVTLQAAVAVRDKVIQAYLDVIRMPI